MAAQEVLVLFVLVRIQTGQQKNNYENKRKCILPVYRNPDTWEEETSPSRIYYNSAGSITVMEDKTGKIIKEIPAKKK